MYDFALSSRAMHLGIKKGFGMRNDHKSTNIISLENFLEALKERFKK